jgi:hypothetical protein
VTGQLRHPARRHLRLPRPERLRQVDDHPHARGCWHRPRAASPASTASTSPGTPSAGSTGSAT